jgi:hypothetical protein
VWGISTTHVLSRIRNCRILFSDDIPIKTDGPGWVIHNNDKFTSPAGKVIHYKV